MAAILYGTNRDYAEARTILMEYFKGDQEKVNAWLNTFNPLLGAKPIDMIARGRGWKLLKWMKAARAGHGP